jgi:N-acetylneuraminate synthase
MLKLDRPLIIFEMANNHMGDVEHGRAIISALREASEGYDFEFAVKFQYRQLDTFIHPDFQDRMDLKFVKRFSETRLSDGQFMELKAACEDAGFSTMCTPFDEPSVDKIEAQGYDYLKVASCSVKDWPLLERVASADLPVIVSTGGATMRDVDNVVSFMTHRNRPFALMHCVGIYPTENNALALNRIDWFRDRYPEVPIGFSTHEAPAEAVPAAMAAAKHARIFEKHVALVTGQYPRNAYSATPEEVRTWLETIAEALSINGPGPYEDHRVDQRELDALEDLKRGAFARHPIPEGKEFSQDDVFFAMPNQPGQMTAEAFSKHNLRFVSTRHHDGGGPLTGYEVASRDVRSQIAFVIHTVRSLLNEARIALNPDAEVELSHHYGIENFEKTGATIITCINREYCKKLIVQIPGQTHPIHHHEKKEESFQVLAGILIVDDGDGERAYGPGDIILVRRGERHSFRSDHGVVFEEVSTTHYSDDSFYDAPGIVEPAKRKTRLVDWELRF